MTELRVAVGSVDTVPEHDPYHRGEARATTTVLAIDPERNPPRVSVGQEWDTGAVSALIWHNRIIQLVLTDVDQVYGTITPDAEPLEAFLKGDEGQALLGRIVDGYDTEWDGHNLKGHLDADAQAALEKLEAAIDKLPTTTYILVNAGDWLHETASTYVKGDTADEELEAIAADCQNEDGTIDYDGMKVILDESVLDYLKTYREEHKEDEMEKIKIYRSQLEVWTLEELGLDEWPRLSASDMPAALVILEDDKPPEACTVWGLPHKMSVEDAWEEFEHSDEYIVVD